MKYHYHLFHFQILGCSKCSKEFPRQTVDGGKTKGDFSGFNRNSWIARDPTAHKRIAELARTAKTQTEQKQTESTGARWTDLFRLEYFNPISGHAIDPMHCMFLGIAKHMMKLYTKTGIIDKHGLAKVQQHMDSFRVPSSIGRIPQKIASGFSSFTADQWKNWTMIFSSVVLKPVLPDKHYKVWLKFAHATSLLARKVLSQADIELADQLLVRFCGDVEQTYGTAAITPNFHMICHLADVIKEQGPVYSFWCFSFERYVKL